jgi:AcrR family transcriptional regulator
VIRVVKFYLSVEKRSTVSETAERLMDLAEAHIRNDGIRGFSFRDLAAESGIKSASVHHDFPTWATMAAAVAALRRPFPYRSRSAPE